MIICKLQGWKEWLPGCKALANLLGHLVERLVAKCIRGTAMHPSHHASKQLLEAWRNGDGSNCESSPVHLAPFATLKLGLGCQGVFLGRSGEAENAAEPVSKVTVTTSLLMLTT